MSFLISGLYYVIDTLSLGSRQRYWYPKARFQFYVIRKSLIFPVSLKEVIMTKEKHVFIHGNPEKWDTTNLYTKFLDRERFDPEFVELIEKEVEARGGIETIKKIHEEETRNKEEEEKRKKKKTRLTAILLVSTFCVISVAFAFYLVLTREQRAYERALQINSRAEYSSFLKMYPNNIHADEIRLQLIQSGILGLYAGNERNPLNDFDEKFKSDINEFNIQYYNPRTKLIDRIVASMNLEILDVMKQNLVVDVVLPRSSLEDDFPSLKEETAFSRKFDGEIERIFSFNRSCVERIEEDPQLHQFFSNILEESDSIPSFELINFHGLMFREILEDKTGMDGKLTR